GLLTYLGYPLLLFATGESVGSELLAASLREGARLGAPGVGGCKDGLFERPAGDSDIAPAI
ncbi:MAG: hypothetical protein ACREIL_06455, partial [Nitrospiraceae bacterium]